MQGSPWKTIARWIGAALLCLVPVGCAAWWRPVPALPMRNAVVRQEMVVHSDFSLPPHHWLLEELSLLRERLSQAVGHEPSNLPVHVYVFETEEQFNAFIAEYYPDFPSRRAFFVRRETELTVYAFWGPLVAEDLRHEMTHGYLHAILPRTPLWIDEGLAEHFETSPEQDGLNQAHLQLLLEKRRLGTWRPRLARLEQLESSAAMSQLDYAEAWLWVHWLLHSGENERQQLQVYLTALHENQPTEPLSAILAQSHPDLERTIEDHLRRLAHSPTVDSRDKNGD